MTLFYEIFPVFLFFISFKFYGIYVATVVGIVATAVQVIVNKLWKKNWDRKQVITLIVFVLFGSMTLYFHNPIFVKWKPTVVFWVFALFILGSQFFTKKPMMQRLMEKMLIEQGKAVIPANVWTYINLMWAICFLILGAVNLYVAYHLSNNAWVNFKFYGITASLIILSIIQAFYLMRYMPGDEK